MTGLAYLLFGPIGLLLWLAAILGGALTALSYWQPLTANFGDRVLDPQLADHGLRLPRGEADP